MNGDTITVRHSTDADVVAILRIYAHYVLHSAATFEEIVPSLEEFSRRRQDVLAAGLPFLVTEEAGGHVSVCALLASSAILSSLP